MSCENSGSEKCLFNRLPDIRAEFRGSSKPVNVIYVGCELCDVTAKLTKVILPYEDGDLRPTVFTYMGPIKSSKASTVK
jgi:hypothetical protein